MNADHMASILDGTAEACRLTDDVSDWTTEQRGLVLDRIREAVREETTLAERIRVVMAGGFEHAEIPDLMGHCIHCGAEIVAVREHKSGYCWNFADPILAPLMRRAVRLSRWTRSTAAYLRGQL